MKRCLIFPLFVLLLFTSCGTPTPQATPQLVNVYATSAAYPLLSELYNCASSSMVVNLSDPQSADITLRVGQPVDLTAPAYQIGEDDVLVVVHPQTGVGPLTLEQVRELFLGQVANWQELGGNDVPVQVWVFSPREDVQQIFDQTVMNGQPVTSLARLAVSAPSMSDAVGTQAGSVGILTRRWKMGNTTEAFVVAASVSVLAIAKSEPQGVVKELLSCLQAAK